MANSYRWGAWKDTVIDRDGGKSIDQQHPYVHWWQQADGSIPYAEQFKLANVSALQFLIKRLEENVARRKKPNRRRRRKPIFGDNPIDGRDVPIPPKSRNKGWKPPEEPGDVVEWTPDEVKAKLLKGNEDLEENTVIAGIIDSGIALGHRRFRLPNGKTRFLASWQQVATWKDQTYLPFGHELYGYQINEKLRKFSDKGDRHAALNDDAFNRDAQVKLVQPKRLTGAGQRDLDYRGAHGTHVLDLFSGYDPTIKGHKKVAKQCRIIAVNLPTPFVHGPAVNFLQFFAIFALERIVALADALWEARFPNKKGRFPIVVNMSYGMQAGPKNGSLPFETVVRSLVRDYGRRGGLLRVVMPSGNKNQARGTARFKPEKDALEELPWRILPSDHTSNVMEIWTPDRRRGGGVLKTNDFTLSIKPPDGPRMKVPRIRATKKATSKQKLPPLNKHIDLIDSDKGIVARVYCRVHLYENNEGEVRQRLQTIFCIAPTTTVEPNIGVALAPSGIWKIGFTTKLRIRPTIDVHVQADHAGELSSWKALSSYFDDPAYARFDPTGRQLDSFAYEPDQRGEDGTSDVTRQGTHNPLATIPYVLMIGGYDVWDGRPALYSASGRVRRRRASRLDVEAAMPSEDNPSTFGILAAGSRDGARVTFRGTSMSCALAARYLVEAVVNHGVRDLRRDYNSRWLGKEALWAEYSRPGHYSDAAQAKVGYGRFAYPSTYLTGLRYAESGRNDRPRVIER